MRSLTHCDTVERANQPGLVPGSTLPGPGGVDGPSPARAVNGVEISYRQFGRGGDLVVITGDASTMTLSETSRWRDVLLASSRGDYAYARSRSPVP